MPELTWILDRLTGATLVGGADLALAALRGPLEALLGPAEETGCALPLRLLSPPSPNPGELAVGPWVQVAGYYHDSLVEGPGRRSSALLAGCPLACPGCRVPYLHPDEAGLPVPVDRVAEVLLDPAHERDGVSLLGGEPFAQPAGLIGLVRALRARGCPHILAYSGYTYEQLRRIARVRRAVGAVLNDLDILIDGPFVQHLAGTAGPWTGSGNQRVIDLVATRAEGRVVLLGEPALPDESSGSGNDTPPEEQAHA
jgi:anaerobic ribonucleoside-triphosphate reductase activating protein